MHILPKILPVLIVVLCLTVAQRSWQVFSISTAHAEKEATVKEEIQETTEKTATTKEALTANVPENVGRLEGQEIIDFTPSELDLLQSLRERREKIRNREEGLQQQERILEAMQQRLENKVTELNNIKAQIEEMRSDIVTLSQKFKKNENAQIESLTRIYEKMKSKDAARIFNKLDMAIVIDVVKSMKEARVAPIMAAMDPVKATLITQELGERTTLPALNDNTEGQPKQAANQNTPTKKTPPL